MSGDALAEAEEAHLALLDEARHCHDRLLDRHGRIDAVLVVEVDHLDAEALQRSVAGVLHVSRGLPFTPLGPPGLWDLAELRRQHHPVAQALERPPTTSLVLAPAIHVGAVEEVDAGLDRPADQIDRGGLVRLAVDAGQRHAAEAEGRDEGAGASQAPMGQGGHLRYLPRLFEVRPKEGVAPVRLLTGGRSRQHRQGNAPAP